MRILGIDPGLRHTGFGVIEAKGGSPGYVACGVIKTEEAGRDLLARIGIIFAGLGEVITQYQPDIAVLEIVFVNVNPQSTLLLGQARGAALAALSHAGLPVAQYTALQIKKSVTGYGKADKNQVQQMIIRLLSLPRAPGSDAADALAAALTHAHHARLDAVQKN